MLLVGQVDRSCVAQASQWRQMEMRLDKFQRRQPKVWSVRHADLDKTTSAKQTMPQRSSVRPVRSIVSLSPMASAAHSWPRARTGHGEKKPAVSLLRAREIHMIVPRASAVPPDNDGTEDKQSWRPKDYTFTICMVPPPSAADIWDKVTEARTELKDPGLFRWPPHVNILYPFVSTKPKKTDGPALVDPDILHRLQAAAKQVEPFVVTLKDLGTFGGRKRGVLWLYPSSRLANDSSEPFRVLCNKLGEQFPKFWSSRFSPHMTLSHFESLEGAQAAQTQIEQWWPQEGLQFVLKEIYILHRKGDNGQFMRVASIGLGQESVVQVHDPHLAFPAMPAVEEAWVRDERLAMKARRKGSDSRRGGRRYANLSRSSDSPEVIEAKRAARKAKREQMEQAHTGKNAGPG